MNTDNIHLACLLTCLSRAGWCTVSRVSSCPRLHIASVHTLSWAWAWGASAACSTPHQCQIPICKFCRVIPKWSYESIWLSKDIQRFKIWLKTLKFVSPYSGTFCLAVWFLILWSYRNLKIWQQIASLESRKISWMMALIKNLSHFYTFLDTF